ncbi:MAG: hypothetical protein IPH44_08360 [Myxococcales bacterium]|nr:hypothetical protein [Myxococcales bacterium]MBK7198563.1 hypothetical protein [Myxococcales bacterium]MBP6846545.1 hypothetical protein [Kofleriaceae bacterium]
MKLWHGSIARALAIAVVAMTCGCLSKKEIKTARNSVYDTEFANVYSAAVEAVRSLYPTFEENPTNGVIKTAWHQVKFSDPNADDPKSTQVADRAAGVGSASPNPAGLGYNPSFARRMYFIKFSVVVAGIRPFRVRVVGSASELRPGDALPTELKGEAVPHWLAGRTDELIVKIYRRLKKHAVAAPEEKVAPEELEAVVVDGDIPVGAQEAAADVVRALHKRDYAALRAQVADDVVWSRGAAPGADVAMAMWQADPTVLAALEAAITAGCHGDGEQVVCPASGAAAHAEFRLRGGVWKLTAFVDGDR